jgi:hypothetical protein
VSNLLYLAGVDGIPRGNNQLVNGGFDIWQRGAGPFTADLAYTADRWQIDVAGTDTIQADREATTKKTNSQYSSKLAFTLGNGAGASRYRQRLVIADGYHHLLGKTVSVRLPVHANAASAARAVIATDGTSGTSTYSSYHAGNSAWSDLDAVNVTVPTDATYIDIGVALAANVTAYVDNAMLDVGVSARPFMALTPQEELAKCLRYYEEHGGESTAMYIKTHVLSSGDGGGQQIPYMATKAATPTVTKNGTWAVVSCNQPTVSGSYISKKGYFIYATSTAGNVVIAFGCDGTDDTITIEANP